MSARLDPDPRRARVRLGVGAALVLVLLGLGVAVLVAAVSPRGASAVVSAGDRGGEAGDDGDGDQGTGVGPGEQPGSTSGAIFVHILGHVVTPGLYELDEGARAVDAVAAAGGFAADADQASLNLARFLSDGEQIIVPAVGEPPPGAAGSGGITADGAAAGAKVNLNTADAAALETLPRVGPAMAERIIAWREANGRFVAVEDLMSVTGIGEKTFEGLRELVTT